MNIYATHFHTFFPVRHSFMHFKKKKRKKGYLSLLSCQKRLHGDRHGIYIDMIIVCL